MNRTNIYPAIFIAFVFSLFLFLISPGKFVRASVSPSQSITGEVFTHGQDLSKSSTYCAKFTIGFTEHHKIYIKQKEESELNQQLQDCRSAAKKLESSLKNKSAAVTAPTNIIQPFRENYYYKKTYPEKITVPDLTKPLFHDRNAEGNWKYDKNFYDYFYESDPTQPSAINQFCRAYIDESNNDLVSYELRNRPKYSDGRIHSDDEQTIVKCGDIKVIHECSQKNVFKYNISYQTNQGGIKKPISVTETHKCEDLTMDISTEGEWFQNGPNKTLDENASKLIELTDAFTTNILSGYATGVHLGFDMFISPPTSISNCGDRDTCLSSIGERQTIKGSSGKGIHRVPKNFESIVSNSISAQGDGKYLNCAEGKCAAKASGERYLETTIPATSYFGQCKNQIIDLTLPEASIPAQKSQAIFNIVNRPPVVSITFPNNTSLTTLRPNEKIRVLCDAIDPDYCCDKITKIKWECYNSKREKKDCHFLNSKNIQYEGAYIEEVTDKTPSNPYRSIVEFSGTEKDAYAVTCEAFDNDINTGKKIPSPGSPGSFKSEAGISSEGSGLGIGGLNIDKNLPINYGVLPEKVKFCSVFTDQGSSKKICQQESEVKITAYFSETLHPEKYKWNCDNGQSENITSNGDYTCKYNEAGKTYAPKLSIKEAGSDEWIGCLEQAKIKLIGDGSHTCHVLIRKAGTSDEFTDTIKTIYANDGAIEAKVFRECVEQTNIDWSTTNGSQESSDKEKESAIFKFSVAGVGSIKAKIGSINCKEINLTVKDKLFIR